MDVIKSIVETYFNNPKVLILTIVLVFLTVFLKKNYPKFRGFMGEFWVKLELKKLPKDKYLILNDVMIIDEKGTHQIDHIVLSKFGIFVIEMKNYYGLIKGREFDNEWCQYLGKHKSYFINPIHQNYGHIKSLSSLLNLDEKFFISIVCFSNQAKLKIKVNCIVTQVGFLKNEILKFKDEILLDDMKKISTSIKNKNIIDKKLRKQHVLNINEVKKENNKLINNFICPKCGGVLVEKSGRYGKFLGCKNFPKCKYVKKI